MKWSEFFEKEMNSIGEDLIVEAMECNKVTVELKAYYVESRPNIFKNIMTAAACILLAVAMTVSFVLMRRSITPGGQPTTDTETETNEPETTDREPEPDTDTTASEDTEMPVEELPVPEDGEQLVFLCVGRSYRSAEDPNVFEEVEFVYDENGNLTEIYGSDNTYKMTYNECELVEIFREYDNGKANRTITFENGKCVKSKLCDFNVEQTIYEYDEKGNCIAAESRISGGSYHNLYKFDYDNEGKIVRKQTIDVLGDVIAVDFLYDNNGFLSRIDYYYNDILEWQYGYEYNEIGKVNLHSRTLISESETEYFKYDYDEDGNLVLMTMLDDEGNEIGGSAYRLTYDEQSRLVRFDKTDFLGAYGEYIDSSEEPYEFVYDKYGNLVEERHAGSTLSTYTYRAVCVSCETANKLKETAETLSIYLDGEALFSNTLYDAVDDMICPDKYLTCTVWIP